MPLVTKQSAKAPAKKSGSVIDRISDMDFGSGIKINLYGRSGTGKTTLWSTFPKPILAIVCSGGSKPGELRSINTPENRKVIKQVILSSSSEVGELTKYLEANPQLFKTAVLDHASGLQDLILKEILGLEEVPPQLSWGLASQQQYGQLALQMKERLRSLLGLPQHVVIVAQERNFNEDNNSDVMLPYVASALVPSVTGWLNPACDYVCQTFIRQKEETTTQTIGGKQVKLRSKVRGVEYCLRTAADPIYTTKFRLPKGTPLPDVLIDPTFEKINKLING